MMQLLYRRAGLISPLLCLLSTSMAMGQLATLTSGGGAASPGGVSVTVDAFGTFTGAQFYPTSEAGPAETVRYNSVFLQAGSGGEWLDADWLGPAGFSSTTSSTAVSAFVFGDLTISLSQQIVAANGGARLIQTYSLTNTGDTPQSIAATSYLDADVLFNGNDADGGKAATDAASGSWVIGFDQTGSLSDPQAYVAQRVELENATASGYEIGEYWALYEKIDGGLALGDTVLNDSSGDGIVDTAFDLAVAQSHDVLLPNGATYDLTVTTDFGVGSPESVVPEPASMTALMAGGLGLLIRRRKHHSSNRQETRRD